MNNGLETLNIRTIVMSPRDPSLLFAGTNGSGLYCSTDGGETWTPCAVDRSHRSSGRRDPLNDERRPPCRSSCSSVMAKRTGTAAGKSWATGLFR
ncbi:MAG: hypothetical protein KatS3mg082_1600 [Nitrospiraceae bacterium]|nr:MAG: hypothetical protein KatS3mg082_1600 [Nitrospiraceae bacterium]